MKEGKNKMVQRLDKEIEMCWKEYEGAPKLTEEEIDRIVKDARRSVKRGSEVER